MTLLADFLTVLMCAGTVTVSYYIAWRMWHRGR